MNLGGMGRGFASVADDITRTQMGQRLATGMIDDVAGQVGRNLPGISASEASEVIAQAQDDAARWYAKFVEPNEQIPNGVNPMLYKFGKGAARTGNFVKNNGGGIAAMGMNAALMTPMVMSIMPQSQEEQQYYG
jgi:hypothetical protein